MLYYSDKCITQNEYKDIHTLFGATAGKKAVNINRNVGHYGEIHRKNRIWFVIYKGLNILMKS